MKSRMILLLILIQATIVTRTTAQFFGVTEGSSFTPLSTLEVRGSFGASLYKDLSTNSAAQVAAITLTTTVIFSNKNGEGRTAIQLPAASSCLNRVYIIVNTPSSTGGKDWALQGAMTYTDLFNAKIGAVPLGTSVMIISNGTDWLQIN